METAGGACLEVTLESKVAQLRRWRPGRMHAMTLAFWRELPPAASAS